MQKWTSFIEEVATPMKDKIILIQVLTHLLFIKLKAFLGIKMYTFISRIYVKYNLKRHYSVIVNVFNQFSLQNCEAITRRISCLSLDFSFTSFVFSIVKVLLWNIAFTLQTLVKSFSLLVIHEMLKAFLT